MADRGAPERSEDLNTEVRYGLYVMRSALDRNRAACSLIKFRAVQPVDDSTKVVPPDCPAVRDGAHAATSRASRKGGGWH